MFEDAIDMGRIRVHFGRGGGGEMVRIKSERTFEYMHVRERTRATLKSTMRCEMFWREERMHFG